MEAQKLAREAVDKYRILDEEFRQYKATAEDRGRADAARLLKERQDSKDSMAKLRQ